MNILSFDIEEWFHVFEDHNNTSEYKWSTFKKRLPYTIDSILEILEENNVKATFFCLGWIARQYPDIIKKIDSHGFEIGSHSDLHKLAFNQNIKEFELDLKTSINSIEDVTNTKVESFRAPGFSINASNLWVFEVLMNNGIKYDSSIFPIERKFGGVKSFPINSPFLIESHGMLLKEFPMNAFNVLGKNIVFSGGGFFRLFPYAIIKAFINHSDYVMTYLHPRDFDNNQPFNELILSRHIKSKIGTKNSLEKLKRMINDYQFLDLSQAEKMVDWDKVEVVKI